MSICHVVKSEKETANPKRQYVVRTDCPDKVVTRLLSPFLMNGHNPTLAKGRRAIVSPVENFVRSSALDDFSEDQDGWRSATYASAHKK